MKAPVQKKNSDGNYWLILSIYILGGDKLCGIMDKSIFSNLNMKKIAISINKKNNRPNVQKRFKNKIVSLLVAVVILP